METIKVNGTVRMNVGKKPTKSLRYEGKVPCILYGNKEQIHFSMFENEFKELVYTNKAYKVLLNIGGKEYNAILQDAQFHPVSDMVLHLDFMELIPDKKIIMEIPVKIIGIAPGIAEGGKLMSKLRKIKVKALPEKLPNFIEVNVSELALGKSVKISDLSFTGFEVLDPPTNAIVTVEIPRAVVEETVTKPVAEGDAAKATEPGKDAPAATDAASKDAPPAAEDKKDKKEK